MTPQSNLNSLEDLAERADFEAWRATQPEPDHKVVGYEHALYMRWCAVLVGRWTAAQAEATRDTADADAAPLIAYTDGSGTQAHLPCGAGVVVVDGDETILEVSRFLGNGTNNRAELAAIGIAVATTADPPLVSRELVIRTDSEYARGALTRDGDTDPWRPNAKLINHIRELLRRGRRWRIEHVPGHSGIPGNERADALAGIARRRGIAGIAAARFGGAP